MKRGVVIAGGGLAAQRCAETLRARGYDGAVRMLCAEAEPPYDRPPLSKEWLVSADAPHPALRPGSWYDDAAVELCLGHRVARLHHHESRVELAGGALVGYDLLLIATGSRPRSIAHLRQFSNVHTLRTLGDARRLRERLSAGMRLAVVGAGFIGQEVAASARARGVEVTMIEALEAPLVRILGARVGEWFARLHREEGVDVLTSASVAGARGRRGALRELVLDDGARVACDVVVVGVGVEPDCAWVAGTELDPRGVRTDAAGRTAIPGVFAAGDAACAFEPRLGAFVRTEHWDAAARQGATAAQAMLWAFPPTPPLPSFWSDQYGLRIQFVGHGGRSDGVLVHGDPAARDFSALYLRGGVPVAGLTVNRPRDIVRMRRQIERGCLDPEAETERTAA